MENSSLGTSSGPKFNPANGRATETATGAAHGAVDKVAAAAGSTAQTVNAMIDQAAASGHQAVNRIEEKVKPAEQWIHEKTDALLAAPTNAISDARQYIVTHPWQSLGVAVLAGLLLGRRTK